MELFPGVTCLEEAGTQPWHPTPSGCPPPKQAVSTGTFPLSQPQSMMMEISITSLVFRSKQSQLLIAAASGQRRRRMTPYRGRQWGSVPG